MSLLINDVSKSFGDNKVIDSLNIELESNRILCIVGPSGCGKSTLLNIIAGLTEPDQGNIDLENEKVSYVFQEDRLLPWLTVYENIAIVQSKAKKDEVMELIDIIGLKDFADYYPDQLSGGMRQRCSIARAFFYKAPLLLMDEPFKSLDHDLRISMVKYLINIWKESKNTIVFVTHNIDEALLLGHQIIVLSRQPAQKAASFEIKKEHNQRKLIDPYLIEIRNKIIKLLGKENREAV